MCDMGTTMDLKPYGVVSSRLITGNIFISNVCNRGLFGTHIPEIDDGSKRFSSRLPYLKHLCILFLSRPCTSIQTEALEHFIFP
jgi:hypothetical protein